MRVVILNPGPRGDFAKIFDVSAKSEHKSAPFFWKRDETNGVIHRKKISLAVPLFNLSPPEYRDFGYFSVIFNPGFFFEIKIGRQRKGAQNVRNEHINAHQNS